MAFCSKCGKQLEENMKFCPDCGISVDSKFTDSQNTPPGMPPKTEKVNTKKKGCFGCLGIIILLIVLGAVFGGGSSNKTSQTTAQQPKSEAELYPYTCNVEGVGKVRGGVSSNVGVAIAKIQEVSSIDGSFSTTNAQGIFKVLYVVASNQQKDAVTLDANSFKLIDDKGREFSHSIHGDTALQMKGRKTLFLERINPGITAGGYVAFDVPKDANIVKMQFSGGMSGKKSEVPFKIMNAE